MRAVSFVEHIQFDFNGPVLRNGLALGDVDNDGNDELVVGNESGDITIFKGTEIWQTIHGLGFISCIVIGDILNRKQNCLTIIGADGWCYIYCCMKNMKDSSSAEELTTTTVPEEEETVDGMVFSAQSSQVQDNTDDNQETDENKEDDEILQCVHTQRIPANSKVALLGDVDGDGSIEIVLGLTDRVVRSYRWVNSPHLVSSSESKIQSLMKYTNISGRLVGLNKWECANQIGSVTLHHSADGSPCLLVAQPGGTFMRIKCQPEDAFGHNTENFDMSENNSLRSESFAASFVDYQFLGLSRMRNQNISTEILGDLTTGDSLSVNVPIRNDSTESTDSQLSESENKSKTKGKPYAVATLDGTIMLVQDEIILWAIQVDHQTFALSKLDVTGNGCDDIVVCSWDGQTYILDQEKNSVRFQVDEPVQAFCSGYYTVEPGEKAVPCLIYVTFWNKIYVYYNIMLPNMITKRFNPDLSKIRGIQTLLDCAGISENAQNATRHTKQQIVQYLLYGVKS